MTTRQLLELLSSLPNNKDKFNGGHMVRCFLYESCVQLGKIEVDAHLQKGVVT